MSGPAWGRKRKREETPPEATDLLRDLRADAPKRQVDARPARTRFFVDAVLPIALGLARHQQQAARRQIQTDRLYSRSRFVLQGEGAYFPYAHRRNDRSFPELPLVVAVESDAIAVIAIIVEQDAVEDYPGGRFFSFGNKPP